MVVGEGGEGPPTMYGTANFSGANSAATLDILRDVFILYFHIHSNYRSDIKVKEDFRYARTQALYFPYALSLDLLEDVLQ